MSFATDSLANIQTAISQRLSGGAMTAYSWEGRSVSLIPLSELFKIRAGLQFEVAQERQTCTFLLGSTRGPGGSYPRFGTRLS